MPKISIVLGIVILAAGIVLVALSQWLPIRGDLLVPGIIIVVIGSTLITFGTVKK